MEKWMRLCQNSTKLMNESINDRGRYRAARAAKKYVNNFPLVVHCIIVIVLDYF